MALTVGAPSVDGNGVISYTATSAYQSTTTTLRILRPTNTRSNRPHRFLYILPVEVGLDTTFGDGFEQARTLDIHNTFNCTLIGPQFVEVPWYGNHASTATIRQADFMNLDLRPWVAANEAGGGEHWLLGFSKSGWGATNLILQNPTLWDRAAAWDSPYTLPDTSLFNMADVFGTDNNYQTNYLFTQAHVTAWATGFTSRKRLWISGDHANVSAVDTDYDLQVATLDGYLEVAGIKRTYAYGQNPIVHSWTSGWMGRAVAGLNRMYEFEREQKKDTFTVAADTDLASLTPESAGTWSYSIGSANKVKAKTSGDTVKAISADGVLYLGMLTNTKALSVDQEITGTFNSGLVWTLTTPAVRVTANNGYCIVWNNSGTTAYDLYRIDAGSFTLLQVAWITPVREGTDVVRLRARGTNPVILTADVNYGTEVTYSDSNASRKQSGAPGILFYTAVGTTNIAFADDISVRNLGGLKAQMQFHYNHQ